MYAPKSRWRGLNDLWESKDPSLLNELRQMIHFAKKTRNSTVRAGGTFHFPLDANNGTVIKGPNPQRQ